MRTRTKNNTTREVAEFLKTLDRVAVTTHVGADGDAIGASAALVRLMRSLGAAAIFCHAEEVPSYLRWLLPDEAFRELPPDHDLLVVDTSRADRTGVPVPETGARLNLDHHEDNPLYAEFNLVNPRAAASAEIVADLHAELGVPLDKEAAEALYAGIRTDTGDFRFRNISPRAHEMVADLLRAGVVPAEVHERINRRGSVEQLNIVGVSLANARCYGEVLVSTVDNSDYARTGATELDSKESIDQLRNVAGVDVVAHLREVPLAGRVDLGGAR
ncbi:MAG: DHH family phosphoesterase [Actinobacteria bacterium]|nr:DHH family phosphoesterase [Actinomycetota bacterium]